MAGEPTNNVYMEPGGDTLVVRAADGGTIKGQASAGGTPAQAAASANLTDSSGGTASSTIAAIGATYDQAEVRNAVASLTAKVNDLLKAARDAGLVAQ